MGVEAGARRGASERDLADAAERRADAVGAQADLRRVAAELLAERDRDGVHQMCAAGLDDVAELVGLAPQSGGKLVEGRQQVARDLLERGQVDRRREDVVRGLAEVDVIVRVGLVTGEVGHHLVRVHVRGGARAGLEDVDGELVVVLAGGDRVAGRGDALRDVGVEQVELGVGPSRGRLQPAEPVDDRRRDRLAGDGEVGDRLVGLPSPELGLGLGARHVASSIFQRRYSRMDDHS